MITIQEAKNNQQKYMEYLTQMSELNADKCLKEVLQGIEMYSSIGYPYFNAPFYYPIHKSVEDALIALGYTVMYSTDSFYWIWVSW